MEKYPHFMQALRDLAPTNVERARMLGVACSTMHNYMHGISLPPVEKVKEHPVLDNALTRDIRGETPCRCGQMHA